MRAHRATKQNRTFWCVFTLLLLSFVFSITADITDEIILGLVEVAMMFALAEPGQKFNVGDMYLEVTFYQANHPKLFISEHENNRNVQQEQLNRLAIVMTLSFSC